MSSAKTAAILSRGRRIRKCQDYAYEIYPNKISTYETYLNQIYFINIIQFEIEFLY